MLNRREFAALLASAALIAPGARGETNPAPRSGGELLFGFDGAAVVTFVLDPHNSGFAPHNRVFRSIFDSLVVLQSDQSLGPWLATAWETSPDQKSYTFKLRTDVKFHDGTAFNAAAVKANLDRIKDPKNALTALPDIGPYTGAELLADDTIRVNLSEPFAPLLRNLSKTTLGIVSPAALAKYGATLSEHPIGSGPFRFVSLSQGTEIRLERNPDYQWAPPTAAHQGPAYLDRITFKNVPEEATRVAALQSTQLHAVDFIPPQNLVALKADPSFRVQQKELLNNNYALYINVSKAPWDDEDIRRAAQISLDLDTIVRIIYLGTTPRAWASLSPSIFASADKALAKSWKPDPPKAKEILDGKGWKPGADGIREKDGKRLTLNFIDTQGNREKRLDIIQLIRRQLAASGIQLAIDSEPLGTYTQKAANNEFELTAASQFAPEPDVLRALFVPDNRPAVNGIKVDDPELTRLLNEGRREGEPRRRLELYEQAQRRIIEKVYAIPVYVLLYNIGSTTAVSGIEIDTHGFPNFQSAWLGA